MQADVEWPDSQVLTWPNKRGFLGTVPYVKGHSIDSVTCFLFMSANGTLQIVPEKSRFGQDFDCDFCVFAPVLSSIHSFIWCWFIVLFR